MRVRVGIFTGVTVARSFFQALEDRGLKIKIMKVLVFRGRVEVRGCCGARRAVSARARLKRQAILTAARGVHARVLD